MGSQIFTICLLRYGIILVKYQLFGTNYVYLDLIRTLSETGYQVIHTLDWIKLTAHGNLMKTRGHYLQHNKETLIVARRKVSSQKKISDTLSPQPDFIQEKQVIAGGKPQTVMERLEKWFDRATLRVELYARHHNLRSGWWSVGNELCGPGLHAIIVLFSEILIRFRPL